MRHRDLVSTETFGGFPVFHEILFGSAIKSFPDIMSKAHREAGISGIILVFLFSFLFFF